MAVLSQLLGNRDLAWEDNLEKGRIWVYQEGNEYTTKFCMNGTGGCWCWKSPGTGKVVIEAWGASGSGSKSCCCAKGTPGNPGAYVRKCICVDNTNWMCGCIGFSCGNADAEQFRNCSQPTMLSWTGCAIYPQYLQPLNPLELNGQDSWKGNNPWGLGNQETFGTVEYHTPGGYYQGGPTCIGTGNCVCTGGFGGAGNGCNGQSNLCCATGASCGCICAQGGKAGYSICSNNPSPFTCFQSGPNFCATAVGMFNQCNPQYSQCGIVCNMRTSRCTNWNWYDIACGFGGDVNCCGMFSCVTMLNCVMNCNCASQHHIHTSAGKYATEGSVLSFTPAEDSQMARSSGMNITGQRMLNASGSRWPSYGFVNACYNSFSGCNCYEDMGCHPMNPAGTPGMGALPCGDVRDHGTRGGHGAVRIKFIPDEGATAY